MRKGLDSLGIRYMKWQGRTEMRSSKKI